MDVLDEGINSISEKTDQHTVTETLDTLSNIFYKNSWSWIGMMIIKT